MAIPNFLAEDKKALLVVDSFLVGEEIAFLVEGKIVFVDVDKMTILGEVVLANVGEEALIIKINHPR